MKIINKKIILDEKDNSSQEAFDKVLRKFKKLTRRLGIIKEARENMIFVKPSEKKRKKRLANLRNKRKNDV